MIQLSAKICNFVGEKDMNKPVLLSSRLLAAILVGVCICLSAQRTSAFSLALDSVAEWGKFPRFCVNVYRWGDRFFNTYDSAYVKGTGTKFNVKFKLESWFDNYNFRFTEDNVRMTMVSDPNTTAGVWLTYLAVSAGYDFNISRFFGGAKTSRRRWNFRLNCALLTAELYWITNDVDTRIVSMGSGSSISHPNYRFTGLDTKVFGLDTYYFFNNKRYSRAAAFNYSKLQQRSQGSWFLGFSYWVQDYTFDFGQLPDDMRSQLPESWAADGYRYVLRNNNYALRSGYGYNWVLNKHWTIGVSESPLLGIKHGRENNDPSKVSLSLYNRAQASAVWNNRRWFAGLIISAENGLFYNKEHTLISGVFTVEASVGFRFNIW